MPYTLQLSNDYGYVILSAVASVLMTNWLAQRTIGFRRQAKLPYPTPYASHEAQATDAKAYAFNCAVRAHANTLEQYPGFLVSLLIAGVQYPKTSAALGLAWVISRIHYATGYTNSKLGDGGAGRARGLWGFALQFVLQGLAGFAGYNMLTTKSTLI